MRLFLEILDGEQKGERFAIRDGLTIGRKASDVTIRDSKVSGLHAKIKIQDDESVWLIDQGSTNGIKFKDRRIRELVLADGTQFLLGRTSFAVVAEDEMPEDTGVIITKEPAPQPLTWLDHIRHLCQKGIQEGRSVKKDLARFQPLLRLKFIRGVQMGTEWTLGYGPRSVGAKSVDLLLDEAGAPGVCFELLPHHDGVLFKPSTQSSVKLNGKWVESEFLKDGDVIDIQNTQIQVILESEPQ